MELVFQEERMEYLCAVLSDTVTQEQTADVIVPDSYPDAERIVDAFGTLLLRSEECGSESASVAGYVQAGVLYLGQGGQLRQIRTEIPFSLRREFAAQERCTLQCTAVLHSVDARILNSRKILVRVGFSCTVRVYASKTCVCYDLPEPSDNLQLKRRQLPLRMPMGLGEKSFVLNEELELPADQPEIAHLLKCLYRPRIQEQKMVGNKAVFKGSLLVHALYEAGDGSLHSHDWLLPFSQYAEMDRPLDECEPRTELTLTGADTEPDSQLDSRRLLTSVNLLAQCTAIGVQTLPLIEDAFCTDALLTPQWEETRMSGILDCQSFRETVTAQKELPIGSVVDAWVYPKPVNRQRFGQEMELELPMSCNVLYLDGEGELQQECVAMSFTLRTELSENASCCVQDLELGDLFANGGGGTLLLRLPLTLMVESRAEHSLRRVCGGELSPLAQEAPKPALILRFTQEPEQIWEIAKSCQTPVAGILSANDLTQDTVPANTLLLIPMS